MIVALIVAEVLIWILLARLIARAQEDVRKGFPQGSYNLAWGRYAGYDLRLGSNNVLIGNYTLTPSPDSCHSINLFNRVKIEDAPLLARFLHLLIRPFALFYGRNFYGCIFTPKAETDRDRDFLTRYRFRFKKLA